MDTVSVIFWMLCGIHVLFRGGYLFYIGGILRSRSSVKPSSERRSEWIAFKERASFVLTLDAETFVAAAIAGCGWGAFSSWPFLPDVLPEEAWMMIGVALITVGGYVKWDAYRIIGDRGWYWYNFFCPPQQTDFEVEGVYRYLDNPMYGVGYLPLFGAAFLLLSTGGVLLAAFDTVMIWLFYYFCERPHTVNVLHEEHEVVNG